MSNESIINLVAACCEKTAVLDFGRLIAAGPTATIHDESPSTLVRRTRRPRARGRR